MLDEETFAALDEVQQVLLGLTREHLYTLAENRKYDHIVRLQRGLRFEYMRIFAHLDVEFLCFNQNFPRGLGHFPPGVNVDIITRNQQNPDLGLLIGRIDCRTGNQHHNTN